MNAILFIQFIYYWVYVNSKHDDGESEGFANNLVVAIISRIHMLIYLHTKSHVLHPERTAYSFHLSIIYFTKAGKELPKAFKKKNPKPQLGCGGARL